MSSQIQPFDFRGIQVRVLTDEHGNPWFLGADVCTILSTATNHIRELRIRSAFPPPLPAVIGMPS